MNDPVARAYSGQYGGDLPYFVGKQYGSGWLRSLARFAFPILKRVVGVATNTAEDVLVEKKPFVKSLKNNAMSELTSAFTNNRDVSLPINRRKKRRATQRNKISESGTIFANKRRKLK